MLEIHFTAAEDAAVITQKILAAKLTQDFEIRRTKNGKPYIEGDPLFFSVSHSGKKAVIAVCDSPVGVDLEEIKHRSYSAVLSRFSAAEQAEISTAEEFLTHWVVREAYVKAVGSTLAEKLKKLTFVKGKLYDGGTAVDCELTIGGRDGCVYCVCIDKSRTVLV